MPTVAELNALTDYVGNNLPDISSQDFESLYTPRGKAVLWWKGWRVPADATGPNGEARQRNGMVYVPQELAPEVRVMVYQTKRDTMTPDFGLVEKGATAMSTIPRWMEMASGDQVSFPDAAILARDTVTRGATDTDALPFTPVADITAVLVADALANVATYQAVANGIKWLSGAPAANVVYFVEYHYAPRWEWLIDEQSVMQSGQDGSKLPQRGVLRLVKPVNVGI
jgi:hypothetical protein